LLARRLVSGVLATALYLRFRRVTERLGDLVLALVAAVQVDQRDAGRGVAHTVHKLPQRGSRARRQIIAWVAQIVEMTSAEPGTLDSAEPDMIAGNCCAAAVYRPRL